MAITIRTLGHGDEQVLVNTAMGVFDDPILADRTREFLDDPRHHLLVALDDELVVGFVSAVHYIHPDKPQPELWINEISVASTHRERGVAKALLRSLLDLGQSVGCDEAWVLTEQSNTAAVALYSAMGGAASADEPIVFTYRLTD